MNILLYTCLLPVFLPFGGLCKNTLRRYFTVLMNITLLKYFVCQCEEQVLSDVLPPRTLLLAAKSCRKVNAEAAVPG